MAAGNVKSKNKCKKKKKVRRKIEKNILDSPYVTTWPAVGEEEEVRLMQLLGKLLAQVRLPEMKIEWESIRGVAKKERRRFRQQKREQVRKKEGLERSPEFRQHLVLGVNHLARSIEKGEVVSAVIARDVDPQMLTRFLVALAATRCMPLIAVTKMEEVTKESMGYVCNAIGFKRGVESEGNPFHSLHIKIKELTASLPKKDWMGQDAPLQQESYSPLQGESSNENMQEEAAPGPDSIYLYRSSDKYRVFVPKHDLDQEF